MRNRVGFVVAMIASVSILWGCERGETVSGPEAEVAEVEVSETRVEANAEAPSAPVAVAVEERVRPRPEHRADTPRAERDLARRQAHGERASAPGLAGTVSEVGENRIVLRIADRVAGGGDGAMRQREVQGAVDALSDETVTIRFTADTQARVWGSKEEGRRAARIAPDDIEAGDLVRIWLVEDSEVAGRIMVMRRPANP